MGVSQTGEAIQQQQSTSSIREFQRALWGFGESLSLVDPEEFSGISDVALKATRSMQLGTPGYLEYEEKEHYHQIRIVLILLRIFKVRSRLNFWMGDHELGEIGFIPEFVKVYEWERNNAVQIDGKEHDTSAKVEIVNGMVKLRLFPYGPGEECAFELIMKGPEAEMLGTWLQSKGRQATDHHKALNQYYGTARNK